MGCFQSTAKRQHPGYEDPVHLAAHTAFSVSEVKALFELFKSISGSLIDDGLINKVPGSVIWRWIRLFVPEDAAVAATL